MQAYEAIFQTISMRSFSSIWYWLVVVGLWMTVVNRALGVPLDLIMHVNRHPEDARAVRDMTDLLRVNTGRMQPGVFTVAVAAFVLSVSVALGVAGSELAQAVAFIALPLALVQVLRLRLAARLRHETEPVRISKALIWHRLFVQLIAMVSIFATAIWGILRNLSVAVLN